MTHFGFGTRASVDTSILQSVQGTLAGLDLEDTFQVTPTGLISASDPMTVAQQQQTAQAIAAGVLGPGEPGPSTLFTRNVSPVDVWSLAHVGVGAILALSGFGPFALALVAASTEGIEFLLQREGIIQDETIQNRIGDVIAAGVGFAAVRALA